MTKGWSCLSLAVVVAGCGVEQPGDENLSSNEVVAVAQTSQALCSSGPIPAPPALITAPVAFNPAGMALVPRTSQSAYTVIYEDPSSSAYFLAWGFDVRANRNTFYVRGNKRLHYQAFNTMLADQLADWAIAAGGISRDNGSQNQSPKKPGGGGPGPIGYPELVKRHSEAVQQDMINVGTLACGTAVTPPIKPLANVQEWMKYNGTFPGSVKSAQLVVAQHPTNAKLFLAWGFDAASGKNLFYVQGNVAGNDYNDLIERVGSDMAIPMNNPTFTGYGSAGQIGRPPRGPGPIGDWAYQQAINVTKISP